MKQEKQKEIELVLSKLTAEEKVNLGLVEKEVKIREDFKFKIEYMIGDADGYIKEKAIISVNNPFLKIITDALDKLKVCEGLRGVRLNDENYNGNYENKNISKLELDLLCLVSGHSYNEETVIIDFFKKYSFENSEVNYDYLHEFNDLLIDASGYLFLTYEGYKLK